MDRSSQHQRMAEQCPIEKDPVQDSVSIFKICNSLNAGGDGRSFASAAMNGNTRKKIQQRRTRTRRTDEEQQQTGVYLAGYNDISYKRTDHSSNYNYRKKSSEQSENITPKIMAISTLYGKQQNKKSIIIKLDEPINKQARLEQTTTKAPGSAMEKIKAAKHKER